MRATDEERQQVYYQSYKAYIISQGLEIPFPLRYLLKDEYLIISTDKRFSPYQSPAPSPENLGRREVVLENLEGRVCELEKKVNIQASNENNYNYDKPNNYDNIYTEFSPSDRGHFDHFNEEPNEESNEEPKQEPIKEPKVEPNEETVVEVGVELGSDANEETVIEVAPEDCKARRARKRGIACKCPYIVEFGRKKKNVSATGPLIMIPQDYTGFALESFVDVLMGAKAEGWLNNVHVEVWIKLLQESRINKVDWTIMSYKYFSTPELLTTWSPWAEGAALKDEPTIIPWWKVGRVFLPINHSDKHWILGELHLKTVTVHIYDSLVKMRSYQSLVANETISTFKTSLIDLLDGINFWTKTNQARKKPADIQFEVVKGLDQQKGKLGDCGVFMCMWLEKLISGMPLTKEKDADRAALDFRM